MATAVGFIALMLAFGVPYVMLMRHMRNQAISNQRNLIENAFMAHGVDGVFDPSTAVLVRERDEIRGGNAVSVQAHRIYRTNAGEYFLFICTAGEVGYLTQLSPERTVNALRSTPDLLRTEFPNTI